MLGLTLLILVIVVMTYRRSRAQSLLGPPRRLRGLQLAEVQLWAAQDTTTTAQRADAFSTETLAPLPKKCFDLQIFGRIPLYKTCRTRQLSDHLPAVGAYQGRPTTRDPATPASSTGLRSHGSDWGPILQDFFVATSSKAFSESTVGVP